MDACIHTYACFLDVSKDVASYVAIAIIILLLISIATYVAIYSKEKTVLENETHATHMHVCFETVRMRTFHTQSSTRDLLLTYPTRILSQ